MNKPLKKWACIWAAIVTFTFLIVAPVFSRPITDGAGGSKGARVDDDHRLHTNDITNPRIHDESANPQKQRAFSWSGGLFGYSADTTLMFVQNTDSSNTLFIEEFCISTDVITGVTIFTPETVTTPSGTATVTPTNLNTLSSKALGNTAVMGDTANTEDGVLGVFLIPAGEFKIIRLGRALVLGVNKGVGIKVDTGGSTAYVTTIGYYHP